MSSSKINWPAIQISSVFLYLAVLFASTRVPYLSNRLADVLFNYVISFLIFCYMAYLYIRPKNGERPLSKIYSGDYSEYGRGVFAVTKIFLVVAVFCALVGVVSKFLLAYPTSFWASNNFVTPGKVSENYGHSFSIYGYTRLEVTFKDGHEVGFFWPNEKAAPLKVGTCASVYGKSWLLGSNVERIEIAQCPSS